MGDSTRRGGHVSELRATKGALAAVFYVIVLEYSTALSFRYLIPNLPVATLDDLYVASWVMAIIGAIVIYRFLPNSKKPVF